MKRFLRSSAATITAAIVIACLGGTAMAAWIISGSGAGSANAGAIEAVPTPQATRSGTTITVSGFATTVTGGASVDSYTVTRRAAATPNEIAATPCANLSASTSPLQCEELNVPVGSWVYRVEAKKGSWSRESNDSNEVVVEPQVAPSPTLNSVASPNNVTKPAFSGTAGDAAGDSSTLTLRIYSGSTAAGAAARTLTATRQGTSWSIGATEWAGAAALTDGTWTAQVFQQGTAGTGTSASRTFLIDSAAPNVTLTAVATPTNETRPGFSGTAGSAATTSATSADAVTVTVEVYSGTTASGAASRTVTTERSGSSWSVTGAAWTAAGEPPLTEGTWTAQAQQSDAAGNAATSETRTFVVDTTAPSVTITQPGAFTNDATPTITGAWGTAADDATTGGLIVRNSQTNAIVYSDSISRSGSTWASTPANKDSLVNGTSYTATFTQEDAAGNVGTAVRAFTVDTVGPDATSITVSNGNGQIQQGDEIRFVFDERLAPDSVPTGARQMTLSRATASNAAVNINIQGVTQGANSTGATGWLNNNATATFSGTLSLSADGKTITYTVGTCTCTVNSGTTASFTGNFAYTPATTLTDMAGNAPSSGHTQNALRLF